MYCEHCPATDMQNGDEVSASIILAGRALWMKMLITLEPRYARGSNFEYFFFLFSHFLIFFFFLNTYVV